MEVIIRIVHKGVCKCKKGSNTNKQTSVSSRWTDGSATETGVGEGIYKVWGRGKSIFSCNHVGGWWNNYTVSGLKARLEIKICRCVYMYTRTHTAGLSIFKESDNRKEPTT